MHTYFLALGYKGTRFAGFQIQDNAQTIQGEVERAASVYLRSPISLTGSSRTDAGVHAMLNYFHFHYILLLLLDNDLHLFWIVHR